jgi:hypothetical protein
MRARRGTRDVGSSGIRHDLRIDDEQGGVRIGGRGLAHHRIGELHGFALLEAIDRRQGFLRDQLLAHLFAPDEGGDAQRAAVGRDDPLDLLLAFDDRADVEIERARIDVVARLLVAFRAVVVEHHPFLGEPQRDRRTEAWIGRVAHGQAGVRVGRVEQPHRDGFDFRRMAGEVG